MTADSEKRDLPDFLLSTPVNISLNASRLAVATAILCRTFVSGIIEQCGGHYLVVSEP